MKSKKGWYILLAVWAILLAAGILSYAGVLPLGKVSEWFFPACAVGIIACVWNIISKN